MLSAEDVSKNNSKESCWIIVHGKVYDVTEFLDDHPGGSRIILKYAGKDATEEYDLIHPPGTITTYLPREKHLGPVDPKSVKKVIKVITQEEKDRTARFKVRPPLDECLSLHDFETVARNVMPSKGWAYYSSAADDEITHRENHLAYHRIWFRPRVLRDVTKVDFSTSILGQKCSMPIYIVRRNIEVANPVGLGHADGELNLTRAAAKKGIIQMIPTLASVPFDDIVSTASPFPSQSTPQPQFLQLYVNRDRAATKRFVEHAEARGIKGLFITVDAPQLGRREKDMRMKFEDGGPALQRDSEEQMNRSQGAAKAITSFIDPGLSWKDIPWFKSITNMPIVLKGIQCWEDAVLAAESGVQGVVLSNHGGRQLDFARSGIEVLVEVVAALKDRKMFPNPNFQIFVDGGVRRASDVLKALALGATAVGIGRPFIYAYSAYGQAGVEKALGILHDEFEMDMRLLGANTLRDIVPAMVDSTSLTNHSVAVPEDRLYTSNYESLCGPQFVKAKL